MTVREGARRPITVYEPKRSPAKPLGRLRRHLYLAGFFGHNYVKKYYKDTYLGLLWIPLRPTADVFVRSLLFGGFLGVSVGDRPYLVFLIVGSIGWYFFDRTTLWSYRSLQYNQRHFRTLALPWLPAVTGSVVPGILQALLYGLIGLAIASYYRVTDGSFYVSLGSETFYAGLGLLMLLGYAWGLGLVLAPLVRVIRDIRLVFRYVITVWYMMTPVLYSVQTIPEKYRPIVLYNPLSAPIEYVRHGLLQMELPDQRSVATSAIVLAVLLPLGLILFLRAERSARDRL